MVLGQVTECRICGEVEGDEGRDGLQRYLGGDPYVRRVVLESAHLAAVPSLGALAPGHLLVCPKRHVTSFAHLTEVEARDARAFIGEAAAALTAAFGSPVSFFEHGIGEEAPDHSCVAHAHLHCVPMRNPFWRFLPPECEWQPAARDSTWFESIPAGTEYLYCRDGSGRGAVAVARVGSFESQLLRRVAAAALGRMHAWNWRLTPAVDLVVATLEGLSPTAAQSRPPP